MTPAQAGRIAALDILFLFAVAVTAVFGPLLMVNAMAEIILLVIAAVCAIIAALWEFTRGPHFGWLAVLFLILALIAGSVGGGSGLTKRSDYPWHPLNRPTQFNDIIGESGRVNITVFRVGGYTGIILPIAENTPVEIGGLSR